MHYSKYKVAIVGFGVEGQDALRYFLGQKSTISVLDKKEKAQLNVNEWKDAPVTWKCGPDYLEDGLRDFNVIVRSPGVYRYLPEIVEAEKQGSKITSNTILFFEESKANIIGITGTKGKGTTARMLEAGLRNAEKKVLLLGNIGTPMLNRIDDADTFDWVILELSSFQLIDLPYSPPIAIVTNITTDHLNWHKDREEYIHAKENLWKYQHSGDVVVFNKTDDTSVEFAKSAPGEVVWFSSADTSGVDARKLRVPGQHNLENALAALAAAKAAGADPKKAWEGICQFEGVEHKLEKVAEIDGVTYINDSAATTPEATIAALKSFPNPKILIAGGSLKGVGFRALAQSIAENDVKIVFLIGESAGEIEGELEKVEKCTRSDSGELGVIKGIENMRELVGKAKELARSGNVVLLSPACASFGLFRDYKDRGDKFKEAVRRLKSASTM